MNNGRGNPDHIGHRPTCDKYVSTPTRLISESDRKMLALHGNSDISPADARNVYFKKTDKFLSYHQVSYMFGITSEELFGTTKNVGDASNNVLDYLTKKKIRYVSLCQDGVTDESLYLSYNNGKTVEISHLENKSILSPAFSCADKY